MHQLMGEKCYCFYFGSQSEGTTTPGLNSDIDLLQSDKKIIIMKDWSDREARMNNLLMFREKITPPQQYMLQTIKRDTPEVVTRINDERWVRKDPGQELLSSERWNQDSEQELSMQGREITKQGPSGSHVPNWDIVYAIQVCKPLPEIQYWITRCGGKHWPPSNLLEAARVAPSFLVLLVIRTVITSAKNSDCLRILLKEC
ncbi:hypothetical protein DPMN_183180 [Dreissena polymorpha]|uniref:Uncharacterized protein n=1 Tax=Dreissena polymorpha TaxID=45954 RepID=A0A9D4DHY0_DREPO|nr:hypothetical protein DPMN_183180 [Dreissena polymorpha]